MWSKFVSPGFSFPTLKKSELLFHKEQIVLVFQKVKKVEHSFSSSCSFKKSDKSESERVDNSERAKEWIPINLCHGDFMLNIGSTQKFWKNKYKRIQYKVHSVNHEQWWLNCCVSGKSVTGKITEHVTLSRQCFIKNIINVWWKYFDKCL